MIQFAMEKLRVAGEDGNPELLDVTAFEHEIAEAFRKAGFNDAWMAEDIALTVEEKIRGEEARLFSRNDIDAMVSSLLNASGFQDVERLYAESKGVDRFLEERKMLRRWNDEELVKLLARVLPLSHSQTETLAAKAGDVLKHCGLELATDKFIVSLAMHIFLNDVRDMDFHSTEKVLEYSRKPAAAAKKMTLAAQKSGELQKSGILRKMPCSNIFPKARLMVDFSKMPQVADGGWVSSISMTAPVAEIIPAMANILEETRGALLENHPDMADIPASVVLTGLPEGELREVAAPIVRELLKDELTFDCIILVR